MAGTTVKRHNSGSAPHMRARGVQTTRKERELSKTAKNQLGVVLTMFEKGAMVRPKLTNQYQEAKRLSRGENKVKHYPILCRRGLLEFDHRVREFWDGVPNLLVPAGWFAGCQRKERSAMF